ncbi:MAG: GGDEF domain-containing protein [Lachnospiraceae bacterium]|nr:GGDEF domain-containing protein [Lachnospiraceae bacterium]
MESAKIKAAFNLSMQVSLAITFGFILTYLYLSISFTRLPDGILDVSGSWLTRTEGETFVRPNTRDRFLRKGEEVEIRFFAPTLYGSMNESLCFVSQGTAFVMYDWLGREVYSYGMDLLEEHRMIPRKVHFIRIPERAKQHSLCLQFVAAQNGARVRFRSAYYGDVEKLETIYFKRKSFALLCGLFLMGFGFLLIMLRFFFKGWFSKLYGTFFQGMLLFDIGLYTLCYNDLFSLFVRNERISTFVEYLSCMFLPILIHQCIMRNQDRRRKRLPYFICQLMLGMVGIVILLHFLKVVHINELGPVIQAVLLIWAFYALGWLTLTIRRDLERMGAELYANISRRCIYFGLYSMILLSLCDFFLSATGQSYGIFINQDTRGLFIMLGGCILIGDMLLSYFFHTVGSMQEEEVRERLEGLAYTDELTGLSNRAHCDRFMAENSVKHLKCVIVSFDLDGLKKINDIEGHQAGDAYLTGFAALLTENFGRETLLGRMGGDEFIMITTDLDVLKLDNRLYKMFLMAKDDQIRFSYGYAVSDEVPGGNLQTVYMLADQRMYRMKDQHYEESGEEKS